MLYPRPPEPTTSYECSAFDYSLLEDRILLPLSAVMYCTLAHRHQLFRIDEGPLTTVHSKKESCCRHQPSCVVPSPTGTDYFVWWSADDYRLIEVRILLPSSAVMCSVLAHWFRVLRMNRVLLTTVCSSSAFDCSRKESCCRHQDSCVVPSTTGTDYFVM